jgi:hypothetical protein
MKDIPPKNLKQISNASRRSFLGLSIKTGTFFLATTLLPRSVMGGTLKKKMDTAQNNRAAKFHVGEKVRVSSNRFPIGHYRTPMYIRGKVGRVERVLSQFLNPEEEGYGKNEGSTVQLYLVHFKQTDVWPSYSGKKSDELGIEIYEHWLEKF